MGLGNSRELGWTFLEGWRFRSLAAQRHSAREKHDGSLGFGGFGWGAIAQVITEPEATSQRV